MKIIINNKTNIPDNIAIAKVYQFLTDTNILNIPQKAKQFWSYPVPITFGEFVCFYNETKTGTKTFTFMDKGGQR